MPPVAAQSAAEVRVQTALQEVRLALVRQGQIGANTAAAVLAARARDTDNDGTVEPPAMRTSTGMPAGGGAVPLGTAAGIVDGYGTEYGYCAFKNGPNFATPATGLLPGSPTDGLLLAVIFAGPDRVFQTTCAGLKAGGTAQGDDYVATMSTSQTNLGSGISFARPPLATEAALTALATTRNAQCNPSCPGLDPLMQGELRLTLDTNTLWRWDAGQIKFVRVEAPQLSQLAVSTTLRVSGLTTLTGGLTTTGVTNLNATGGAQTQIGNAQSATTIGGDATISGVATVTGQTKLNGGLTAVGSTSINESGTFGTTIGNAGSATTIGGAAKISGAATLLSTATVTGLTTLNGGLTAVGSTSINESGTFGTTIGNAGSATTIGGAATIAGTASLQSTATITGLATLNGGLTAVGATSINGSGVASTTIGNAGSATTIGGAATIAGAASLQSTATVTGLTTLNGGLTAVGATSINGSGSAGTTIGNAGSATSIGGTATITGLTRLNGGLTATGSTTINGSGSAGTTIGNSGSATTIGGPATIAGAASLQSTATVTGLASLNGGLTAIGATSINGSGSAGTTIGNAGSATSIGGTATITGLTRLNGGLTATGSTTINASGSAGTTIGNSGSTTTIGGPATISGAAALQSTATVTGLTTLNGGLTVSGGAVQLNVAGDQAVAIGNSNSSTTLVGSPVLINRSGSGNTEIGSASARTFAYGDWTYAGKIFAQGAIDVQGRTEINTTGVQPTYIGNTSGTGSLTVVQGFSTFKKMATFEGGATIQLGASINTTGASSTTIGNPSSTTLFGGPVVFMDSVGASSLTGSAGLTLSGGTGSVKVSSTSEFSGQVSANGGLSTTVLNVGNALTVSGATTLQQGLSSIGGDVKLNTSGIKSTTIGNSNSKTTIIGYTSINPTGNERTEIGNPTSVLAISAQANFEQGFITKGGNVNINVSRPSDTFLVTTIGDLGGPVRTPIYMNGSTTFNADVKFLGPFALTGSTTINTTGLSNTEVGNPSSTTNFSGPVSFSFGPTMPSITGVNGLTLSSGSTEGFIVVNSASRFGGLISANGGVTTTSLLVNPLASNPPAKVGINTATPAYALDVVGDINASGLVRANGVQLTSDARFKTRIAPLTTALQTLERIEGVAFDWNRAAFPERKFPATRQFGVIAQQVQTVLPELVATDAQGYKSVNYIGFVPLLIEGMKAQQGQLQQQASKLAGHDKLLASQGLRLDAAEARLGKADEALARLAKRADGFERLAQHFSQPADDTLRVEAPRLVASNFTADRIAVETLVAQRLEAEQLKVRKLEADELRVTGDLQARRLVAERVSTGEKELFVSLGTVAPLFEVPEGAHFAVTLSSNDGGYATATVLKAGGALRLVPTSSQGIELVPLGGAVGVMAPSKKVKASWLRTG